MQDEDELSSISRANRLARARKTALEIGMERISEKDDLHRSLKHSSIRAEVTQLTEQNRSQSNELKEARLYIQRLEQKLSQIKENDINNDNNNNKLEKDLNKRIRILELSQTQKKELVISESLRLLNFIKSKISL